MREVISPGRINLRGSPSRRTFITTGHNICKNHSWLKVFLQLQFILLTYFNAKSGSGCWMFLLKCLKYWVWWKNQSVSSAGFSWIFKGSVNEKKKHTWQTFQVRCEKWPVLTNESEWRVWRLRGREATHGKTVKLKTAQKLECSQFLFCFFLFFLPQAVNTTKHFFMSL